MHGDLHGGNVLVDDTGNAQLTDFGLSHLAQATEYNYGSTHGGGMLRFTAPEVNDPEEFQLPSRRPTFRSDMYSFAFTCVEVSVTTCFRSYRVNT